MIYFSLIGSPARYLESWLDGFRDVEFLFSVDTLLSILNRR